MTDSGKVSISLDRYNELCAKEKAVKELDKTILAAAKDKDMVLMTVRYKVSPMSTYSGNLPDLRFPYGLKSLYKQFMTRGDSEIVVFHQGEVMQRLSEEYNKLNEEFQKKQAELAETVDSLYHVKAQATRLASGIHEYNRLPWWKRMFKKVRLTDYRE